MINLKDFSKYPAVIYRTSKQFVKTNAPTILTTLAVGGVISTAVMAAKATPKAKELLEVAWNEKNKHIWLDRDSELKDAQKLTVLETLRIAGPCYTPAAIMGAATIACILGANSINLRRQATLAGLYSASEAALREYKEKTKALIGEKKAGKIEDDIVQDIVNKHDPKTSPVVRTGRGDTWIFDTLSGRYFLSDIEFVRHAQNDINQMIIGDLYVTLNDFYYALGLDGIGLGEDCGWNMEHMLDVKFTGTLMSDGTPCVALGYNVGPIYNYRDLNF